jgi:hypothetical protein
MISHNENIQVLNEKEIMHSSQGGSGSRKMTMDDGDPTYNNNATVSKSQDLLAI